jgi:hypothetical protein
MTLATRLEYRRVGFRAKQAGGQATSKSQLANPLGAGQQVGVSESSGGENLFEMLDLRPVASQPRPTRNQ